MAEPAADYGRRWARTGLAAEPGAGPASRRMDEAAASSVAGVSAAHRTPQSAGRRPDNERQSRDLSSRIDSEKTNTLELAY